MFTLKYLNYKMFYRFLKKGEDQDLALFSANGAVALLIFFLTIGLLNVYCILMNTELVYLLQGSIKIKLFIYYFFLLGLNYLLIFHKKKHINYFDEMYHVDCKNKYSDMLFFVFMWGSYAAVALSFFYIEYKKFGFTRF
jgi:hypothetical protein